MHVNGSARRGLQAPSVRLKLVMFALGVGAFAASPARASQESLKGLPNVERRILKNGLEVVVGENRIVPLVTIEIVLRGGSMSETPTHTGISHICEHMFFRANRTLPTDAAFDARMAELGIQSNASTTAESVTYYATTTKEHTAEAMVLLRDALLSPLLEQTAFEKERAIVLGELDVKESDPDYVFRRRINERLWWKYPDRKTPAGTRAGIRETSLAKVRSHRSRYYVPNNAALIVTGDVDREDAFSQAAKLFGEWTRGPDPFQAQPVPQHPSLAKTSVVVLPAQVGDTKGSFNWHGPATRGRRHADSYPALVLGAVLQAAWSPFQDRLVIQGPCTSARLSWESQSHAGPVVLSFEAQPEFVDRCIQAIRAEIHRMTSPGYFSPTDVAIAVRRIELTLAREREGPSGMAHDLAYWWAAAGLDYYANLASKIAELEPDDLTGFVKQYLLGKPFVLGIMQASNDGGRRADEAHYEKVLRGSFRASADDSR
jgi:zinc protease